MFDQKLSVNTPTKTLAIIFVLVLFASSAFGLAPSHNNRFSSYQPFFSLNKDVVIRNEPSIPIPPGSSVMISNNRSVSGGEHGPGLSAYEMRVILGPSRVYNFQSKQWSFRDRVEEPKRSALLNSWVSHRSRSNASMISLDDSFFSEDPSRICSGNCYPLLKYKR